MADRAARPRSESTRPKDVAKRSHGSGDPLPDLDPSQERVSPPAAVSAVRMIISERSFVVTEWVERDGRDRPRCSPVRGAAGLPAGHEALGRHFPDDR